MNIGQKTSIFLIKVYQKTLSPDHGMFFSHMYPHGCCRYYPTCSQYGSKAIAKHGFFVGWWLAIKRVFRCTPWAEGGIDEVPDKVKK